MNQRNVCLLLTVLIGALWHSWAASTDLRPANDSVSNAKACFELYLHIMSNASNDYAADYGQCRALGNTERMLFALRKQPLRDQVTNDAATLCANIQRCNAQPIDMDYFQCNVQQSVENVNILLGIKLNSSAAIVKLEHQHGQAEREMLLCIIGVQREYVATSMSAYQTLMTCLAN